MEAASAHQFLLFQRLRRRLLGNAARALLRGGAWRVGAILLCSALVWGGVFVLGLGGFHFLRYQTSLPPGLAEDFAGVVFDLGFLVLALGLVFSGGIILYSSLFA